MDLGRAIFLAQTYVQLKRGQRALEILDDFASPDNPLTWLWRANAFRVLQRHDDSLRCARIGLELDPDSEFLHQAVAIAAFAQKQFGAAEEAVKEAIRLDPTYAEAHSMHALILGLTGRREEAAEASLRATKLAPHEQPVRLMDAFVKIQRGDANAADELTRTILEDDPDSAQAHWLRGLSLMQRGRLRRAARHFRIAATRDPGNAAIVRSAKVSNHWLFWPWRMTMPAGWQVASIATSLALAVGFFGDRWTPFWFALATLVVYFVGGLAFIVLSSR